MKIYCGSTKNIFFMALFLTGLLFIMFLFRGHLREMLKNSWHIVTKDINTPCTPDERFAYLRKHPGEIRLAVIGSWKKDDARKTSRKELISKSIQKINGAGGICGRQIVPDWIDVNDSAAVLQENVERISHDPSYFAIIGPDSAGLLLAVKPLLLTCKLLTIAPAVSNMHAHDPGDASLIFMPGISDAQESDAVLNWAQEGKRNNFFLLSEKTFSSVGDARCLEKTFFRHGVTIRARNLLEPTSVERKLRIDFTSHIESYKIQNMLIINDSVDQTIYEKVAVWGLRLIKGDIYFSNPVKGSFSPEDEKRLFVPIHFREEQKPDLILYEETGIDIALEDPCSPSVYRTLFLLADACRQAKSLHQNDVAEALQTKTLNTPFGPFQFAADHFEKDAAVTIISMEALHRRQIKGGKEK